ncbi:MAG TPA: hypothetical protein GXX72_08605, partial [Clostridiaceae bacterium]|nr:hypothetical protein [Clostridiaceae bacterium]
MRRKDVSSFCQKGSLALTFCLLVPVVFSLLLALFDSGVKDRKDLDLTRCLAANIEMNLARFDRKLWQDFGLISLNENFVELSTESYDNKGAITITGESSLYENSVLTEQISRHMKLRFPVNIIREILDRTNKIKISDNMSLESSLNKLTSEEAYVKAGEEISAGPADDVEWKKEFDDYLATEVTTIYEGIASSLMPVHLYDKQGDITSGLKPDFFNPQDMSRIATVFDTLLTAPRTTALDKVYLAAYAMAYFPAAVSSQIISHNSVPRYTPDGRSHLDLSRNRAYELEEIITGLDGKKAAKEVKSRLILLRSLIQLAHHAQDKTLRFTYKMAANAIVTSIAIISLGTVVLPAEPFEYLLLVADAIADGRSDVTRLRDGYGVNFWPEDKSSIILYYHDYMLLMLLVQSEDTLLSRMSKIIQRHCPGPGWVWLKAATVLPTNHRLQQ